MAIIARFSYDIPFGKKSQAFKVMKKWESIGQELGFPKARILVSSIGAPESRIQEEYEFKDLAALQNAWAKLDDPRMPAWQEEMAPYIVPGSHVWEVFRILDL